MLNEPLNTAAPAVVLITGISGSGKSVALHAMEDAGFYCVDNLPPEMLPQLLAVAERDGRKRVAIAVDVRSVANPKGLSNMLSLERLSANARVLFLDAATPALVQRFSETRRRHPLSAAQGQASTDLMQSIELERELLEPIKEFADCFDTSYTTPTQLRSWIKQMVQAPQSGIQLVFESFGFKRGLPMEADFVFDARMLPNPHYDPALRPFSGRDEPVIEFFLRHPQVTDFTRDIGDFIERWLPRFVSDHRSYLTVAVGCTGGQHRSVFITEQLAERFQGPHNALLRHRDIRTSHSQALQDEPFDLSLTPSTLG
jgi:RNase adapter protein RapZ